MIRRGVSVPTVEALRAFIAQETYPHSDSGLRSYMADHPGDPDLERGLALDDSGQRLGGRYGARRDAVPLRARKSAIYG